jgi:serine/threonine protein kinase
MATVHRGWDHRLERQVAIKVLAPAMASDPVVRRRFADEANAAARVAHPNVVTIFDTDERDGAPFIVMECLSGETLATEMAQGPLPEARLRSIASEVLAGLQAAHDLGVVHRDIKPSNLLIGPGGSIKIADFGIAKSLAGADNTAAGDVIGSVAYMAPERLNGKPATNQSDLYSLGVVLYEAATGRKPFSGDTPVAVAHTVVASRPEPLHELRPELDASIAGVIERAMARDANSRFVCAAAMSDAIRCRPELDATVVGARPVIRTTNPEATRKVPVAASAPPAGRSGTTRRARPRPAGSPSRFANRRAWALVATLSVGVLLVAAIALKPGVAPTTAPGHGRSNPPATTAPIPSQLDDSLKHLEDAVRP